VSSTSPSLHSSSSRLSSPSLNLVGKKRLINVDIFACAYLHSPEAHLSFLGGVSSWIHLQRNKMWLSRQVANRWRQHKQRKAMDCDLNITAKWKGVRKGNGCIFLKKLPIFFWVSLHRLHPVSELWDQKCLSPIHLQFLDYR